MRAKAIAVLIKLTLAGSAALTLSACAGARPPAQVAELPADTLQGAGDPARGAILSAAYVFGTPSTVAGRPADAADAIVKLEYLAVEISGNPRWYSFNPLSVLNLLDARREVRAAFGIGPAAEPQLVIDTLHRAANAWRMGDAAAARAALTQGPFADAERAASLLQTLPSFPIAAAATRRITVELNAMDDDNDSGWRP